MALIFRTLTRLTGGNAIWLDPGPAGDVARAGFFEAAAGAVTGTASTTLAGVNQVASGTVAAGGVTGTSGVTLAGVSQVASGTVAVKGTAAQTLAGAASAASGSVAVGGAATQSLDGVSQSAIGAVAVKGTAAQTLAGASSASTGSVAAGGAATQSLDGVSQSATGAVAVKGAAAQTLSGVTQSAVGTVGVKGDAAQTLADIIQTASGGVRVAGAATQVLAGLALSATGKTDIKGTAAQSLAGISQSANGQAASSPVTGAAQTTLQGVSQTATGQSSAGISGGANTTLSGVAQSSLAKVTVKGAGFAILEGIVSLGAGTVASLNVPALPAVNWQPSLDLATSTIIGQAMRFMRLAPVARHDPEAEVLAALHDAYHQSLMECLEASDWSFASTLAVLPSAQLTLDQASDDDLPHIYHLPGDLLTIRRVGTEATRWRCDAGVMRANQPAPLIIRYTARIAVEAALPSTFKAAVALQIASLLGARWAGATIAADDIALQAVMTLKQAMREDSRHAALEPAQAGSDLGYGGSDDWAHEATR